MFGNRYFAPSYFGDRYFGGAATVAPPAVASIDAGAGSGKYRDYEEEWQLQQAILEAQFKVEKIEEKIEEQEQEQEEEAQQAESVDLSGLKSSPKAKQATPIIDYSAQRSELLAQIAVYKAKLQAIRDYEQMIDDEEAILLLM